MPNDTPSRHTSGAFEAAMSSLRSSLQQMIDLTHQNLQNSFRGLIEREDEPCNAAIADDGEIDRLEVLIDRDGMDIMMRFGPVASDMREVLAAMKLSVDLERIADQSVGIARRALKLNAASTVSHVTLVHEMLRYSMDLFEDALRAFKERNIDLALTLKPRDRKLDEMNRQIAEKLSEVMVSDSSHVRTYLHLLVVAHYIERIGDHSKNIAEDAVFLVSAEDIRHQTAGN